MTSKLTAPMLRELRSIARDGNPSDPYEWIHAPGGLWHAAREKVIGALIKRGLITDHNGYEITEAGRAELVLRTQRQP